MDLWIEVHSRLRRDPKLKRFCRKLEIPRPHGLGLLVDLWLWAAEQQIPEGNISTLHRADIAAEIDWPQERADALWEALTATGPVTQEHPKGEPGFVLEGGRIHKWEEFRLAYEHGQVKREEQRDKVRKRVERFRQRQRNRNLTGNDQVTGCNTPTRPYQTIPDQTIEKGRESGEEGSQETGEEATADNQTRLARYLRSLIIRNDPGARVPKDGTKAWSTWILEAERILRIDKRPVEEVRAVILWSQNDDFWRGNILSIPTLRKKFTQLKLQSSRGTGQNGATATAGAAAPKPGEFSKVGQ